MVGELSIRCIIMVDDRKHPGLEAELVLPTGNHCSEGPMHPSCDQSSAPGLLLQVGVSPRALLTQQNGFHI